VDPFVAAPASVRARALPERDADFCASACTVDEECPSGMLCLFERAQSRCGYPEARVGVFGAACAGDEECGGAACVALGEGLEQDCRCFAACPTEPSGGCSAGGRAGGMGWVLGLALALAGVRRRVRRD
ncbi:MAG: hypothetical protein M3Y87_22390, partial [Myxococcota bacterium]|nr:hypothetical protein [Myxococcota bacterium]